MGARLWHVEVYSWREEVVSKAVACRSIQLEGGGCQFIGQRTKCRCVRIFVVLQSLRIFC